MKISTNLEKQVFKLGKIKFDDILYKYLANENFNIQSLIKKHSECDWGNVSLCKISVPPNKNEKMISIFRINDFLITIETKWDCSETIIRITKAKLDKSHLRRNAPKPLLPRSRAQAENSVIS